MSGPPIHRGPHLKYCNFIASASERDALSHPNNLLRRYEQDQSTNRISGGQDERDGARGRPSLCLHIVFDGAMPWRDGAISALSHCTAAIFVAPDCRIPREDLSRVMSRPIRGDRIDHGA